MKPSNLIDPPKKLRHKYRACPVEYDGIRFPSKKEGEYYLHLKNCQRHGDVLFFFHQVPVLLPGNVKYKLDFLVFWADGTVRAIDVKGYKAKEYIIKKKLVESLYSPLKIEEV